MIVVVDSIPGDQHIARCLGVEPGQEHHKNANDVVVGMVAEGLYVLRVLELDPVHVRECYACEHGDVRVLAHVDPVSLWPDARHRSITPSRECTGNRPYSPLS